MIGRLRGELVVREGNAVIVECAGVGYRATVSAHTLASLPSVGEQVVLRVFTNANESKISLYGFGSDDERALFDLLITVKNVGPSSAMAILSGGANPQEIAHLIAAGESAGLKKLPGVGKKTAELLVVELRDKCELLLATWGAGSVQTNGTKGKSVRLPILDDVASALAQLGFRSQEIESVLQELDTGGQESLEVLLRKALRALQRQ